MGRGVPDGLHPGRRCGRARAGHRHRARRRHQRHLRHRRPHRHLQRQRHHLRRGDRYHRRQLEPRRGRDPFLRRAPQPRHRGHLRAHGPQHRQRHRYLQRRLDQQPGMDGGGDPHPGRGPGAAADHLPVGPRSHPGHGPRRADRDDAHHPHQPLQRCPGGGDRYVRGEPHRRRSVRGDDGRRHPQQLPGLHHSLPDHRLRRGAGRQRRPDQGGGGHLLRARHHPEQGRHPARRVHDHRLDGCRSPGQPHHHRRPGVGAGALHLRPADGGRVHTAGRLDGRLRRRDLHLQPRLPRHPGQRHHGERGQHLRRRCLQRAGGRHPGAERAGLQHRRPGRRVRQRVRSTGLLEQRGVWERGQRGRGRRLRGRRQPPHLARHDLQQLRRPGRRALPGRRQPRGQQHHHCQQHRFHHRWRHLQPGGWRAGGLQRRLEQHRRRLRRPEWWRPQHLGRPALRGRGGGRLPSPGGLSLCGCRGCDRRGTGCGRAAAHDGRRPRYGPR